MSSISKKKRPLSPHLQVYKPQLTSMMSIFHRVTGFALAIGCFWVTWWLFAAASGADHFKAFHAFAHGWVGRLLLFGWTFSLVYHLLNGMRHLIWDAGSNLDLDGAYRTGRTVIIGSIIITLFLWARAYGIVLFK